MANRRWLGGATPVAQVSTMALQNDFNDSETDITVTMTAEDGSTTQAVSITPSGTDESTIASALQAALAGSSQTLFAAVTWTVDTATVTGTAKVAGVPFYFGSAVTGGAGSITDATGTANAGPNDWNTAANWSGATVPTGSDDVFISTGSFSILYGLDQSSVSLTTFSVGEGFAGTVGDPANGYSLQINGNIGSIRANNAVWWEGDLPSWTISKTGSGTDAVVMRDTTGLELRILGNDVVGGIRVRNGTGGSTFIVANCPRATIDIESGVTINSITMNSGNVTTESDIDDLTISGGSLTTDDCGIFGEYRQYGGRIAANGAVDSGNNGGKWFGETAGRSIFNGTISFAANQAESVTIEQAIVIYGGTVNLRSGFSNITYDNNPIVWGGTLITDQGDTVNPSA